MKRRFWIWAAVLAGVFLAGFLPPYATSRRLQGELQQARRANAAAELRDLAALAYLQASQKNYGMAAETATQYFNRAGALEDPQSRKTLETALGLRDSVSAQLAKGDPAVIGDLERIMVATREATR